MYQFLRAGLLLGWLLVGPGLAHGDTDLYGDPLPEGAVARFGALRLRHTAASRALTFSPDGQVLASGGDDLVVRLWDVKSGKQLASLSGHRNRVVSLWFSRDGATLLSAGAEEGVRVWDVGQRRQLRALPGPGPGATMLAVAPDHRRAAFAHPSSDSVILWDLEKNEEIRSLIGHQRPLYHARFSPDGQLLVTRGRGDLEARLWDVATGRDLRQILMKEKQVTTNLTVGQQGSLAFSADGKLLAFVSYATPVRLIDPATGRELRQTARPGTNQIAFAPDGSYLATDTGGGSLWDPTSGKLLQQLPPRPTITTTLAVSPDSKLIAIGGLNIRIWDVARQKDLHHWPGHDFQVNQAVFLGDGKHVASHAQDGVCVWEAATGKFIDRKSAFLYNGSCLRVSSDGRRVLWRHGVTGQVHSWLPGGTDEVRNSRKLDLKAGLERDWGLSPDGQLHLLSNNKTHALHLFNVATGKTAAVLAGHTGYVIGALFTPDGRMLVTESIDRTTRVWDLSTGQEVRQLFDDERKGNLQLLGVAPDGRTVVQMNIFQGVRFGEVATGRVRLVWGKPKVRPVVLTFTPDQRAVAVGYEDGAVSLRELPGLEERVRWQGHEKSISSLVFSPDGKLLVSTSKDSTALVWRVPAAPTPALVERKKKDLDRLWGELDSQDAALAYRAVWALAGSRTAPGDLQERLLKTPGDAGAARSVRALEVLELQGSAEARQALETLTRPPAPDWLAREARTALERLQRRR